jgi:hypothetical protein
MGRIVDLVEVFDYGDLREDKVPGQVVEGLVASAEDFVERYTGRRFSPDPPLDDNGGDTLDPVTYTFTISSGETVIRIPDLRSATSVLLNGNAILEQISAYGTGYRLGQSQGTPATRIYVNYPLWVGSSPGTLQIIGRWGWLSPPDSVKHAVMALTMRMYRERDAAFADSVAVADGSVLSYFRTMPASIQGSLDLYKAGPRIAVI